MVTEWADEMSRCCSYINSSFRRGPACGVERTEVRSKVPGHSRSDGRGRRTGGLEGTWLTEGTREGLVLFSPHNTRKRTLGEECRPLRNGPRNLLPALGS